MKISLRMSILIDTLSTCRPLLCVAILFLGSCVLSGLDFAEFAHAGTLEGTVRYLGKVSAPQLMPVTKDKDHCGVGVAIQTVKIHDVDGALRDVVVSVEGLSQELEQGTNKQGQVFNMECAFTPRIGIGQKGQDIEVHNQDPILHNTHIKLGKRTILNVAQVPGGKPIVKQLKQAGAHDIRCDKHLFMEATLHVFSHPYYAQTNQAGVFRIAGIPSGNHQIRIWHETLGVLKKMVNVPKEGTVRVDLTYP